MINRLKALLYLVLLLVAATPRPAAATEALAREVLAEVNLARTQPSQYAQYIKELRTHFHGKELWISRRPAVLMTSEGVEAVDEALRFLAKQKPLAPLSWSPGLAKAALELVQEQGESGKVGHSGSRTGGTQERIERHGRWSGRIAENISYGPSNARLMVMQLIIDDDVPDRGHRENIYEPRVREAGAACGPHPTYGIMCVMDFATKMKEKK